MLLQIMRGLYFNTVENLLVDMGSVGLTQSCEQGAHMRLYNSIEYLEKKF